MNWYGEKLTEHWPGPENLQRFLQVIGNLVYFENGYDGCHNMQTLKLRSSCVPCVLQLRITQIL